MHSFVLPFFASDCQETQNLASSEVWKDFPINRSLLFRRDVCRDSGRTRVFADAQSAAHGSTQHAKSVLSIGHRMHRVCLGQTEAFAWVC